MVSRALEGDSPIVGHLLQEGNLLEWLFGAPERLPANTSTGPTQPSARPSLPPPTLKLAAPHHVPAPALASAQQQQGKLLAPSPAHPASAPDGLRWSAHAVLTASEGPPRHLSPRAAWRMTSAAARLVADPARRT